MEISQTRLHNLESLAATHRFGKDFAEAAGISESYFSQLKSGKKVLGTTLAKRICRNLGLEPDALDEPVKAPKEDGGLSPEVMSAAYAIQAMNPPLRTAMVRMILVNASEAPAAAGNGLVQPFEVVVDTRKTDGHSNPAATPRRKTR